MYILHHIEVKSTFNLDVYFEFNFIVYTFDLDV